MKQKQKPEKIKHIMDKIEECVEQDRYTFTFHALERQKERFISLAEIVHVLKNGYEERSKTVFDENYNTWNYSIRGKTIRDELDVRIIVALDENQVLIITVMYVEKLL